jgi:hypothetical protein
MDRAELALPFALLLLLCLSIVLAPAARASKGQQAICCRSAGGTRGTCLNLWAHLVPPSNRFTAGPSRRIALLQGPSASPATMSVQLFGQAGELLLNQVLPAERAVVWLLTLPNPDQPGFGQPLRWESFPTCRPNRPPTRTTLEKGSGRIQPTSPLAAMVESCGKDVNTAQLLRDFELEEWSGKLPESLLVRCLPLRGDPAAVTPSQGHGSTP